MDFHIRDEDKAAADLITSAAVRIPKMADLGIMGMNLPEAWGGPGEFASEAAMAKLFASEMVAKVTDLALRIHGGYGYTRGMPLERYVRDARIMCIYEGSSEVQRNIIARTVLK